ncbi:MAG: DnaJ domain-containing protein [Myxococcaceae bacterium]|nr:DnaJ domain-containing protein [Myxococcaceae bacterium]
MAPAPIAPPQPPAAPALGEFDPFASESVQAMMGAPPPAAPAPGAAPVAPAAAYVPAVAMPPPAFPETGAIDGVNAQTAMAVAQIIGVLNQLDYFQMLRVSHEAKPAEIKKAFYRESRTYHPDRFFHLTEPQVKADIGTIYKRITEAYYFLRDDAKRKKYVADITSAERTAKLRFTEASEVETKQQVKKEQEEQIGTHPKGRSFYATAMKDIDARRFGDAQRNLKSALMYERDNPRYKEKLAEVEQKLHEEFKSKGDQFKIR